MKAFTLIELLVAMLISGIVIASSMEGYIIIRKQSDNYVAISDTINRLLLLHTVFVDDIQKAELIKKIDDQTITLFTREQRNPVVYQISPSSVVRSINSQPDTFFVQTNDLTFKFQDKESQNDIIDEIYFSAMLFNSKETFHFIKEYSVQQLMNFEQESLR